MTTLAPAELAPLDALMLKTDADPMYRSVITGVLVLDGEPGWDRVLAVFEAATHQATRLRHKVVAPLLPVGPPQWVPDASFDLRYHVRRATAPGDGSLAQVLAAASAAATAPFDRARPLWDATLYEGMPGGSAIVLRAHHALADGLGSMEILGALLDLEPDPPVSADVEVASMPDGADSTPAGLLLSRLAAVSMPGSALERNISIGLAAGRLAMQPGGTFAQVAAWAGSVRRLMTADGATPSAVLAQRSRTRRFAALEVPLAALKRVANEADCTVNDAYLAALLGGFRRYQDKQGGAAGDVPLALPINLRGESSGTAGNQFSAAVLSGPATIDDPVERMRAVARLVRQARSEPGLDAPARLAPVLAQLPAALSTLGLAAHARRVDLQASNVMGAPMPTYLAGQRVRRLYPFGPLPGIPAMAVLLSHDGTCCIGVTYDPAAITDAPLFFTCLGEAMDELLDGHATITPVVIPG
ncbi:MAG TPA: wax ester/triacylglycerol synthase domain-containing protein [Streptosporangiaceae bacterium]